MTASRRAATGVPVRWRQLRSGLGATCAALVIGSAALVPNASAQATADGFIPGEATAAAQTMTIGLKLGGGKPLEIGLGNSIARYQNRTATSQGTVLSLGLLQIFLGPTSQCSDLPPLIPEDQLPPVTLGDSRKALVTTPTEVRAPGSAEAPGGVLGSQTAAATAEPQRSDAGTTLTNQDFGVLALDNGTTEVTSTLNGTVREARAVTKGTRLRVLGDIFVINNPRWEAVARSGSVNSQEGSFTFSSATIFGIDRPASEFPNDFMNLSGGFSQMLGFLGFKISYPQVKTDAFGKVEVTPLTVGVENPPIGMDFLKPLFEFLTPAKDKAWSDMISEDCRNAGMLQIADLAIGVLGGTGSATLSVGGVSAFTAATEFPEAVELELNPVEIIESPARAVDTVPMMDVASAPQSFSTSPQVMGASDYSSSLGDVGADMSVPLDTALPEETVPETTAVEQELTTMDLPTANLANNRIIPGSKGGAAAVVGGIGVIGLAALAGADRFIMRRTKREIPD